MYIYFSGSVFLLVFLDHWGFDAVDIRGEEIHTLAQWSGFITFQIYISGSMFSSFFECGRREEE